MKSDTLTVNRHALLRFMNEGDKSANGHHSAMTAFLGEPLAAALVLHYLKGQGKNAEIVSWKVTPGTTKGQRLDVWIADGAGTLYQAEIKMWAGNAIGGLRLKPGLTRDELSERGRKQWAERLWNSEKNEFLAEAVGKVLKPMQPPVGFPNPSIQPLLCLWWLVQPSEEKGPWFHVPIQHDRFKTVNVFSLTAYLMSLEEENLTLYMPVVKERLNWLHLLLPGEPSP